jgi:hypothetical protein
MTDCRYIILPEGPYDDGYYCTTKDTGDGAEDTVTFPWPYIGQDSWDGETSAYIRCYLNGVDTQAFTMPTSASVQFTTAPASGVCIMVRRDSDLSSRKVDFQSGSRHTAGVENLDSKNAFYLVQEMADRLRDMNGVFGEENLFNVYRRTGNGVWTSLPLSTTYGPNNESGITNEAEVLVLFNAAGQQTVAYTLTEVSGVTNVVFSTAPPNGVVVEARTMTSGVAQRINIGNGEITGDMLEDCAINSENWTDKVCIDDLGEPGEVLIWDEDTGGPFLTHRLLTGDDIDDLEDWIGDNLSLSDLLAPTGNLSMGTHKITNVTDPTADQDAATKKYVDDEITAIGGAGTIPQILSGQVSFSSNTYTTETLGFDFDTLILNLVLTVDYTSGGNSYEYDGDRTYTQLSSDGTGEIEYVYNQGVTVGLNQYAFKVQRVTNGFKYKRTGQVSETITIRYTAIKYT